MATSNEKKELVEELKGPHYYRITVNGYGGEASYMRISKEAHDFWKPIGEEHGDSPLVHYIVNAEEYTADAVNEDTEYADYDIDSIPNEAKFMHDVDDKEAVGYSWYEPKDEIEHVWGAGWDSAYVTIEKVDSDDYMSNTLEEIVDREDLSEFCSRIGEETDWEVEIQDGPEKGYNYATKGEYVCQMYSAEKGSFFDGILETPGLLDLKKLKFLVDEAPNGEDTLYSIEYDGEDIENQGGDTNGKGYYAEVWEQKY